MHPYSKPRLYRVCTSCEVAHIENCRLCFGFGQYGKSRAYAPIYAHEAVYARDTETEFQRCPECGSTINGLKIPAWLSLGYAALTMARMIWSAALDKPCYNRCRVNGGAVGAMAHAPRLTRRQSSACRVLRPG